MRDIMYKVEDKKNRRAAQEDLQAAFGDQVVEVAASSPSTPGVPLVRRFDTADLSSSNRPTEQVVLVGPQPTRWTRSTLPCLVCAGYINLNTFDQDINQEKRIESGEVSGNFTSS